MKDITTVCTQDQDTTLDDVLSPGTQHASVHGHRHCVTSPEAFGYSSGYSSQLSSCSAPATVSVTFAPSPCSAVSFVPSSSALIHRVSPSTNFMSSPSLSTSTIVSSPASSAASYGSSPSSTLVPSPSGAFTPSPSPSFGGDMAPLSPPVVVKSEDQFMSSLMSPQQQLLHAAVPGRFAEEKRPVSPGKTVSGNLLPPCRICLDKASGFHYGLNTCEACKGFFRRSLKRGASYVCTRDGKCDVTGERRNLCGYCRYQKCIGLGMSKKAIKTGRYTHAKRTRDTLEIKRLMQSDCGMEEEDDIDFDSIVAQVVKAHDDFVISSTKVPDDFIQQKQQSKVEQTRLKTQWFGEMTNLPPDKHQEIFQMTGIDVDNRREMMHFHVRNSERWIRGYISFAKNLPGFRDLSLNDQANLVKYARIEFWFLGSFPGYSSELGVAVMPNGRCFSREEMYTVWKHKYIDVSFDLSKRLKKLQVTPEEMIIVKAICLTAGDRCSFEEPAKVAKIQWRMVRCLEHLLQQRCTSRAEFVNTFSNVFICLTDLRDLNEAEFQTIQNTQLFELFTKSPLMMEVLPY